MESPLFCSEAEPASESEPTAEAWAPGQRGGRACLRPPPSSCTLAGAVEVEAWEMRRPHPAGGDSGLGPWFSNLSASWNLGETPTPRMRARHAHSMGLACILCPCSCRGIGTDRIGMLHPRILTRQWRNKRQTRVGFPRMIPTEGAHGLHSPRGNSAFFTCEFINHHQERPGEPGADRSHPVRSLTQVATSQREQNRPDGSHADNH